MAETLKDRFEYVMKKKGYTSQVEVLRAVCSELYGNKVNRYEWAEKNKSNFNKALKENRPIKLEVMAGLEHVLETTADYLYRGKSFKQDYNPMGIRYAAYADSIEAYESLSKILKGENYVMSNFDEYGKSLLDYIIEYESINGIRFLSQEYDFKYRTLSNRFDDNSDLHLFVTNKEQAPMSLAKIIEKKEDSELLNNIFDIKEEITYEDHLSDNDIFRNDEFIEMILNNNKLFKDSLREVEMNIEDINEWANMTDFETNIFVNPILKRMLEIALDENHIKNRECVEKAKEIIKFGLSHNEAQIKFLSHHEDLFRDILEVNERGYIMFGEGAAINIGNLLIYNGHITCNMPDDLNKLIEQLNMYEKELEKLYLSASTELAELGKSHKKMVDYILSYTDIKNQDRNDEMVMQEIKAIINKYGSAEVKKDFANKMREVIDEHIQFLRKNWPDHTRNILDFIVASTFVDFKEDELNSL